MLGNGTVRAITDLGRRRGAFADAALVHPTQALRPFLSALADANAPALVDLGPLVGANLTFFGERLRCKVFVADLLADLDACRIAKDDDPSEACAVSLKTCLTHPDESIDGVLCWDVFDYLSRPAAQVLAGELVRILRHGGRLLGFFGDGQLVSSSHRRYEIVDDRHLRHRSRGAGRARHEAWPSREVLKLFDGLVVNESFQLQSGLRAMVFLKSPAVSS